MTPVVGLFVDLVVLVIRLAAPILVMRVKSAPER